MPEFLLTQVGYREVSRSIKVEADTEEEAVALGIENIGDQLWYNGPIDELNLDTTIDEVIPGLND